jgi:hypothetical protein
MPCCPWHAHRPPFGQTKASENIIPPENFQNSRKVDQNKFLIELQSFNGNQIPVLSFYFLLVTVSSKDLSSTPRLRIRDRGYSETPKLSHAYLKRRHPQQIWPPSPLNLKIQIPESLWASKALARCASMLAERGLFNLRL